MSRSAETSEKVESQGLIPHTYDVPWKYCATHRKPIHIEGEWTLNARFL